MKYAFVSGDKYTKFDPIIFVFGDNKFEVICESKKRQRYYYDYLEKNKFADFDSFLRTFSYQNIESGDVNDDIKQQIDKLRDKFVDKKEEESITAKGLNRPDAFDPNAEDRDSDGRVQDGTPFERPAVPKESDVVSRLNRATRKMRRANVDTSISTDESDESFRKSRQNALNRSIQRAKDLRKPSSKIYRGRQRDARQRRRILDGSSFAEYGGIRRLFKSRDDAYDEVKQSTLKTLADMREKAIAGRLTGKYGRALDPKVVEYFQKRTPEQIWDDLEKSALKLHNAVAKMPIEVRTKGDITDLIISQGLLGDPKNRVKRDDMKVPWVVAVLAEHGHELTPEDMSILERNGLLVDSRGRGETYETLREILEQGMGFNGGLDRRGRPIYGYYVTPSDSRNNQPEGSLTEVGTRLQDLSNGPNLPGYSDSALVRVRESVKDRSGYTYGDSLRNGILPRRNGEGDDKDTVLAVVHDRDFTNFKTPERDSELRQIQQEYLLNLLEWNLTGNSSHLTKNDYIEAVVPFDVTPEEIEEIVVASDKLSVFRQELDDAMPAIMAMAAQSDLNAEQYGELLSFLQQQAAGWNDAIKSSGGSEIASFAGLDQNLKSILQMIKGSQLKSAGEEKGIKMTVGPSKTGIPQNLDAAFQELFRRFNP